MCNPGEGSGSATVDVDAWVAAAECHSAEHRIRRVMRIILFAIADSPTLRTKMVMKGGVLLALRYGTHRHTKDVDFSTRNRARFEDPQQMVEALDTALRRARRMDPEVLCRIQSSKMKPPEESASFPTLRIKIGYALQGEKVHQRMTKGAHSPHTVTVDLSFNEQTCLTSKLILDAKHEVLAYSLFDQIAEKYRAMIQQTQDRRNRIRRQDVYDIFTVIRSGYLATRADQETLLDTMQQKFRSRSVDCGRNTISDPEIAERSRREYPQLAHEIDGPLPDFDEVFDVVKRFYLDLPWNPEQD